MNEPIGIPCSPVSRAGRCRTALALAIAVAATLGTGAAAPVGAQIMEPHSYTNLPVGLNFASVGYGYLWGDVLLDPALPITGLDAKINTAVAGYSRVLDVFGQSGVVSIVAPYAWLTANGEVYGEARTVDRSGLADVNLRFSANLYGAPALSLPEFRGYRQDAVVGVSLLVTAPTGRYDAERLINVGTNRWTFRPEVGVSQRIGSWILEVAVGVTFFTDNDDFLGGKVRRQDPLWGVQGHAIHDFGHGRWASFDATVYGGGQTSVDGVTSDDRQENSRLGATFVQSLDAHNAIKLYASTGATARIGSKFKGVGIAYQYRWGGGL